MLNNRLLIVGGKCDRGEGQVTFDDVWTLDLNRMDAWTPIEAGTWREQQWRGKTEADDDEEDDDDEDGEDDDEDGGEEEDEDAVDEEDVAAREATQASIRQLSEDIRILREELNVDMDKEEDTPRAKETLAAFFERTAPFWLDLLGRVPAYRRGFEDLARLTGKELRRLAFKLCKERYDVLLPLLEKLNALDEVQRLQEEAAQEEARAMATVGADGKVVRPSRTDGDDAERGKKKKKKKSSSSSKKKKEKDGGGGGGDDDDDDGDDE